MTVLKSPWKGERPGRTSGFTLIELLTVIAIIGILAAIIIPVAGRVRESAWRAKCASNVRSLAQACHLYANDHGAFPPAEGYRPAPGGTRGGGGRGPQTNWVLELEDGDYLDLVVQADHDKEAITYCPSAVRGRPVTPGNLNTYGINFQTSAGWFDTPGNVRTIEQATDPTRTGMIMDGHWNGSTYVMHTHSPSGIAEPDFVHPASDIGTDNPSSGVNVAFVDTSVRYMTRQDFEEIENDGGPDHIFWKGIP